MVRARGQRHSRVSPSTLPVSLLLSPYKCLPAGRVSHLTDAETPPELTAGCFIPLSTRQH